MSHACAQGLTDVVGELVRRHAYVNTVDKVRLKLRLLFSTNGCCFVQNGDPVLFYAVRGGKEDCVAIILENHADINAIGAVSLHTYDILIIISDLLLN